MSSATSILVNFLCSADSTYRLFGAVTLGNLASAEDHHSEIVTAGALEPLVAISNTADLETQRCIAYALCNLASNPDNRPSITSGGGLPPLISAQRSTGHQWG